MCLDWKIAVEPLKITSYFFNRSSGFIDSYFFTLGARTARTVSKMGLKYKEKKKKVIINKYLHL